MATPVATCRACERLMRTATGCALRDVEGRERVAFGFEGAAGGEVSGEPCTECRVVTGQYHHWGCVRALCRDCGRGEHEGACS